MDRALVTYPPDELLPLDRRYLALAQAYARAGAPDRAERFVDAFRAEVPTELQASSSAELDRARGEIAIARGDYDEAIVAFERSDTGFCQLCSLPGLALAHQLAGHREEAIVAYERYVASTWFFRYETGFYKHGALLGPALERLAELYDEDGNLDAATEHYGRFVALWSDADPELQPRRQRARARLEEILAARG
jgi:tetratricopeptide (TPR) repeat protein